MFSIEIFVDCIVTYKFLRAKYGLPSTLTNFTITSVVSLDLEGITVNFFELPITSKLQKFASMPFWLKEAPKRK